MRCRAALPLWTVLAAAAVLLAESPARPPAPEAPPNLLLVTLDTTRADALGAGVTPVLDALAADGVRYLEAIAPAPLTLPAHATLLTGLDPPQHGVHDNGAGALPAELSTLSTLLAARGFATAAVVGSRVLDRRFGLARGFDSYDDRMLAERLGEYGYPERRASEVVDRALSWFGGRPRDRPFFLWVHFYDPHYPYIPPDGVAVAANARQRYLAEVGIVDGEIGRLLAGLGTERTRTLVAVVGDHGEALGGHGEETHGLLLYRGVLEVPLLLSGPGIPGGRTVEGTVATRRLASTVLTLLGGAPGALPGPPLPGLGAKEGERGDDLGVRSETFLPQTAYGWSPLVAWSRHGARFVRAPRPELYDLARDPAERTNLYDSDRRRARTMARELEALENESPRREAAPIAADSRLAADLAALGYLSGASRKADGTGKPRGLDPKDGLPLLADFDLAVAALARGELATALATLERLAVANPENVPFLTELGRARLLGGDRDRAIAAYRAAARLQPGVDFVHLNLADALRQAGRFAEAEAEYRMALGLDPRSGRGALALASLLRASDRTAEAETLLRRALEDGLDSIAARTELVRAAISAAQWAGAETEAAELLRLAPQSAAAWLLAGEVAERRGDATEAMRRYGRAARLEPRAPEPFLAAGKLLLSRGEHADARKQLESAVARGRGATAGEEAARLLAELD